MSQGASKIQAAEDISAATRVLVFMANDNDSPTRLYAGLLLRHLREIAPLFHRLVNPPEDEEIERNEYRQAVVDDDIVERADVENAHLDAGPAHEASVDIYARLNSTRDKIEFCHERRDRLNKASARFISSLHDGWKRRTLSSKQVAWLDRCVNVLVKHRTV
jgi:hypothetical protein